MRGKHQTNRGTRQGPVPGAREQRPDDEDRLLVKRVKVGDQQAFEALYRRYVSTVYRQAYKLVGNAEEAEEIVQEVFLTLYKKAKTFRGDSAFSTWLYRLTLNTTLMKLRRRKRSKEIALDDYLPRYQEDGHHLRPVVDWSHNPEGRLHSAQIQRTLQQALDQLPAMDKAVVVLSDLDGLANREISKALGLSVPAVKSRLHRARLFLRGKLSVSLGHSPF